MSKYEWREGMGEISGFGGSYEAACRAMLASTLEFWDTQPEEFNPIYEQYENVTGIAIDKNEDAKRLDEAMLAAEFIGPHGTPQRAGEGASGAMHQAVVNHAFFIRANGWEAYVEALREES